LPCSGSGKTVYRKAYFVSPVDLSKTMSYPELYSRLRRHLLDHKDGSNCPLPRRLWMERHLCVNNTGRDLINHEEVFALAQRYGFEILDMPAFRPAQQIAIAHNARLMGGVHAGAFIHSLFMEPRSALVECFSPMYVNPSVIELAQLLEHDFCMLVSDCGHQGYQHGKKVLVNMAHLDLTLQRLDKLFKS
jgi:capsular polysaccharide biosynthesis protein